MEEIKKEVFECVNCGKTSKKPFGKCFFCGGCNIIRVVTIEIKK